jgi:hypothetical protein
MTVLCQPRFWALSAPAEYTAGTAAQAYHGRAQFGEAINPRRRGHAPFD